MGVKGLNKAALTPNHLISPYNITSKSHIKVTRIKETITEKRNFGWLKKFSLRKFIENSMENMQTDLIVFGQM